MTEQPRVTMSPDELAIELFTSGQSMTGGRAEAERLLKQIKDRHAHQLAERIREDTRAFLTSVTATRGADWGRTWAQGREKAADLIDPEATP